MQLSSLSLALTRIGSGFGWAAWGSGPSLDLDFAGQYAPDASLTLGFDNQVYETWVPNADDIPGVYQVKE